MKGAKKSKGILIITVTAILSLLYIIGVTQSTTLHPDNKNENVITKDDSSEGQLSNEDPWTEINKIAKKYMNNNQLSISGNIKLYQYETSKLIEEQKFSYTKSGENMAYSIGSIETAVDKEYSVVVDNTEKIIAVTPLQDNAVPEKVFDIEKLKKLMSEHKATAKVLKNKDQRIIVVENINYDDIANYKLYYSAETYQVIKIVLEMSTPLYLGDITPSAEANDNIIKKDEAANDIDTPIDTLSIDQSLVQDLNDYIVEINYTTEKVYHANTDLVKKIVVIRNKNIYTTEQYKGYELVNQLTQNSASADEGK